MCLAWPRLAWPRLRKKCGALSPLSTAQLFPTPLELDNYHHMPLCLPMVIDGSDSIHELPTLCLARGEAVRHSQAGA